MHHLFYISALYLSCLLGSYDTNYQLLENHGITHAYMSGPLGLKYPSLPGEQLSDIKGINPPSETSPLSNRNPTNVQL